MAADITDTRPDLYRSLMADGWQWRDHRGGGGTFSRGEGRQRVAVQVKRGGACELWLAATTLVARFHPSTPDAVVAAAAVAMRKDIDTETCEAWGCLDDAVYLGLCTKHAEEEVGPAHPTEGELLS